MLDLNKENNHRTSPILNLRKRSPFGSFYKNDHNEDDNGSFHSALGVGGVFITPASSSITQRLPLTNISNPLQRNPGQLTGESVKKKSTVDQNIGINSSGCVSDSSNIGQPQRSSIGSICRNYDSPSSIKFMDGTMDGSMDGSMEDDVVFTTPTPLCVTQRIPLSNISNVLPMGSVDLNIVKNSRSKTSAAKRDHHTTSPVLRKKRSLLVDRSKLAESSAQLFHLQTVTEDVASCNTEFLVEDDEMFYDGDLLYETESDEEEIMFTDEGTSIKEGYSSLGPPTAICHRCHAIMWKEERVNKNMKKRTPDFFLCCAKGQIKLAKAPSPPSYLMQLYNDPQKGQKF